MGRHGRKRLSRLPAACLLCVSWAAHADVRPEQPAAPTRVEAIQDQPERRQLRGEPGWVARLEGLRERAEQLTAHLATAHALLLPRAEREDPALIARLSLAPPRPRPRGYGLLPEIRADPPAAPVEPRRRSYSLRALAGVLDRDVSDSEQLVRRCRTTPPLPLEPLVGEFERVRERMRNVEEHLDYHAYWQQAVVGYGDYFAARNRLLAMAEEMQTLRRNDAEPGQVARLSREIRRQIAPFRRTAGLTLRRGDDGGRILPVRVWTDIDDRAFLEAFEQGVRAAFTDSVAARAARFTVELELRHVPAGELYPDGPPARGAAIDLDGHVARFPGGALVLTTGAASTHSFQGRAVLLGTSPLTRRTLAHEFGHLLGFEDAYLRGYEVEAPDAPGVVLVEWTGLGDDLMGSPAGGQVTPGMIRTLVEAYAERDVEPLP